MAEKSEKTKNLFHRIQVKRSFSEWNKCSKGPQKIYLGKGPLNVDSWA